MDNAQLCQRLDTLIAERSSNVETLWEMVERYVLPFRGEFYRDDEIIRR